MCYFKSSKRKKAEEAVEVHKVMYVWYNPKTDQNDIKVKSLVYHDEENFPDGYAVGDTIEAAERYSKNKSLNAFIIDNFVGHWLEGQVVHAYQSKHEPGGCYASVKLSIPAGNYYWENEDDEIVSTSMTIEEITVAKDLDLNKFEIY